MWSWKQTERVMDSLKALKKLAMEPAQGHLARNRPHEGAARRAFLRFQDESSHSTKPSGHESVSTVNRIYHQQRYQIQVQGGLSRELLASYK
ncbi:MAG: hypothetical protein RRB13_10725 [bacterium]|nr:hypothetical protein [bacterium]